MKSFGKKKKKDGNSNILLETTTSVKKYDTTTISEDVFKIPSKYKEKKHSNKK